MDTIFIVTPGDILGAVFYVLFWLLSVIVLAVTAGARIAKWWKSRR
jgi:hypothetical protein